MHWAPSSSVLSTVLALSTVLILSTQPAGTQGAAMMLRKRPTNLRPPYDQSSSGQHYPAAGSPPDSANSTAPSSRPGESAAANPNYWIPDRYHGNAVCLLAAFAGTVRVRPSNSSFRGGVFHVSPEASLGRRANCERHSRHIFWKFSQHDERLLEPDTPDEDEEEEQLGPVGENAGNSTGPGTARAIRRPVKLVSIEIATRQLSVGFHVVAQLIEFHVAYIECLQPAEKNPATERFRVHSEPRCVNLSVSFDLGSFGDRAGFECSHIWGRFISTDHSLTTH